MSARPEAFTSVDVSGKRPLPDGWRWARLGNVCEVVSGSTPSTGVPDYWNGEIPWVTPTDLGKLNSPVLRSTERQITRAGLSSCGAEMVPPGSVVMSSRAPIGHLAVNEIACCTNQGCKSLIPRESIDTWYLFFALKMSVPEIKALGSGTTFSEISLRAVESFEISLPPIDEQKRIAAILKEQMAAVERARAAAAAQLEAAKALPPAYLRAIFNSPDARHWPRVPLGDVLAAPLKTGISKPTIPDASKRCLTLSTVRNGELELTASKPVDVSDDEAEENWVKPGAFYVIRGNGNLSLVGRGGLAPPKISAPVLYPDLLIEVNVDQKQILIAYLRWIWDSEEIRRDIETRARTSAGIYKINQANLSDVRIPVPPIHEQQHIVDILAQRMAAAERTRKTLEQQLNAINALSGALLCRAFSGEP